MMLEKHREKWGKEWNTKIFCFKYQMSEASVRLCQHTEEWVKCETWSPKTLEDIEAGFSVLLLKANLKLWVLLWEDNKQKEFAGKDYI